MRPARTSGRRAPPGAVVLLVLAALIHGTAVAEQTAFLELDSGEFAFGDKLTYEHDFLLLHLKNGTIPIPLDRAVTVIGCEPPPPGHSWPDKDIRQIERGNVRYQGRWLPRARLSGDRSQAALDLETLDAERLRWESRETKRTKSFSFEYTIDEQRLDRYADYMEAFFQFILREVGAKPSRNNRLLVLFCHDDKTLRHITGNSIRYNEKHRKPLAYADSPLEEARTLRSIRADLTERALSMVDDRREHPAWLREGLIQYFSNAQLDSRGQRFEHGALDRSCLVDIGDDCLLNRWQRIDDILASDYDHLLSAVQRPWVWSLAWFLLTHDKYAKGFRRYVAGMTRHTKAVWGHRGQLDEMTPESQEQILVKLLGTQLEDVQQEWHAAIDELNRPTSAENARLVGLVCMDRGQWNRAEKYLRLAVQLEDESPDCFLALAECLCRRGDPEEARRLLELAVERDPLRARAYFLQGQLCVGKDSEEGWRLMRLALELDPADRELLHAARQTRLEGPVVLGRRDAP